MSRDDDRSDAPAGTEPLRDVPQAGADLPAPRRYGAEPRQEERASGLLDMFGVLRRRALVIIPIVLGCTAAALVLAHVQPRKFTARARLLVEPRKSYFISADAEGSIASAGEIELRTQSLILRSLPVARRVVRMLRLTEQGPLFEAWERAGPSREPVYREDKASEYLLQTIAVDPIFRTRCLEVSCETTDAKWSADIANAFAAAFVTENTERRRQRLTEATAVYATRYPELDREFQEAEAALLRFQEEHLVVSSAQPEATLRQREMQLLKQLSEAQKERVEREARLMQIRARAGNAGDRPDAATPRELARAIGAEDAWVRQLLDTRLEQASMIVELRKSYSDGHRELESAKARLAEIKEELASAAESYVARAESAFKVSVWKEKEIKRLLDEHRDTISRLHQKIAKYEALRQRRDSLRALLDPIARGQAEMDLAASLDIANTRVIEPAQPPGEPSKPRKLNYVLAGLMIGLLLGAGLAYGIDALDEAVRTPADVRRAVFLETFGTVSVMSRHIAPSDADRALAMARLPGSLASEQFRSLRTSILSSGVPDGVPGDPERGAVVLVTSPGLGEGKTTVSLNSAAAFAQLGRPVVVIDADLRRSSIHELLGMSRSPGLVDVLEGEAELKDALRKSAAAGQLPTGGALRRCAPPTSAGLQNRPNARRKVGPLTSGARQPAGGEGGLFVITAGRPTSRPAELLSGKRCREILAEKLWEELRASHGGGRPQSSRAARPIVLIDSPPVIPVADARDLAPMADLVLVVVRAGKTRRRALQRTCELLGTSGSRLGVVINSVTPSVERQYGYSRYGYTYRGRESVPAAGERTS